MASMQIKARKKQANLPSRMLIGRPAEPSNQVRRQEI
jgi:hypothetical protein